MSFNRETEEKIKRFAKEQSQKYLEDAEMTYLERLRRTSGRTKDNIGRKLSKFKGRSEKGLEAENDMMLYMSDYMNDLVSQGLSEQEAFEKASETMKFDSDSEEAADLNERFQQYYATHDPSEYEAIGVFYAGFMVIGSTIGGLIGYLASGGHPELLSGGWIDTAIGALVGLFIGLGLGLINQGIIAMFRRK